MASSRQHAAGLRDQRENVTRLDDVVGPCAGGGGDPNRMGAICRRDARRHAVRGLDRHREIRAMRRAVDRRHRREVQLSRALVGDRHANQAAAELRHEIDRLGRDAIGCDDEIALVLAVFLVDEDDHASIAQLGDNLLDGCDRHRVR